MELAVERMGSGPVLVLLHPLGADRHVWDPILPALAAHRTVFAVDLPGFGDSPALTATPTPRALADAVTAGLGRLGLIRPHIAGNSLGGWVALEQGLAGDAASVTAIAPAGLWPEPLVPKASLAHRLARGLAPLLGPVLATAAGRRIVLTGSMADPGRMTAAEARGLVLAYGGAPGFIAVNNAMRARRFGSLERIRCPVTLVWPDRDRLIRRPVWAPDTVHNVVLTDAGHIPMWDAPEKLVAVLLEGSGGGAGAGAAGGLGTEEGEQGVGGQDGAVDGGGGAVDGGGGARGGAEHGRSGGGGGAGQDGGAWRGGATRT